MIREYVITYKKKKQDGISVTFTEYKIQIPALTLFDAVDYAYNTLELENITEVFEACVGL